MHHYPWLRLVGLTGFLVALMLFLTLARPPFRVYSDPDLTSLIASAYFPRTETLHDLAHERAEFQVAYSGGVCDSDSLTHDGLQSAEVLACNYTGPERAVEQWQGSPAHHAILSDASLNTIGCGSAAGEGGAWFFVCVLASAEPTPMETGPSVDDPATPPGNPANSTPTPEPVLLPNTAIPHDGGAD